DTYRMPGGGGFRPPRASIGENPPNGAVVYYYLKDKPAGEVTLEILDESGKLVKKFNSKGDGEPAQGPPADEEGFGRGGPAPRLGAEPGLNRFVWDLRYPEATRFPGLIFWAGDTRGPRAVPGKYQVRLTVGGKSSTQSFEVK